MTLRSAIRVILLLSLGLLATAPYAWAHHAFAAEYDAERPIDLTGVVTELKWANPHSWLFVDARRRGTVTHWEVEFGAPNVSRIGASGRRTCSRAPGARARLSRKNRGPQAYGVSVTLGDGRIFRTGGVDCPEAGNGGQGLGLPGR